MSSQVLPVIADAMNPDLVGHASKDQNLASAPHHSSWVGASAGTGKTKVLSDRVLRLLLPKGDMAGTEPHKILCLTFTKAGAAEMNIRIAARLAKWASEDEAKLQGDLEKLTGVTPDAKLIEAARQLFARVVDAPGGLNVMTIHAFCESVLRRFPVEAGLPPSFEKLEDPKPLLKKTVLETLGEIQKSESEKPAFQKLVRSLSADDLTQLTGALFKTHRLDFEDGKAQVTGSYETRARHRLGLSLQATYEGAVRDFIDRAFPLFREISAYCDSHAVKGKLVGDFLNSASIFSGWVELNSPPANEIKDRFIADFCTKAGTLKSLKNSDETLNTLYGQLDDAYAKLIETVAALESAELTGQLFAFANKVHTRFARAKERQGLLEFDDLIARTADLFQGRLFGGSLDNAFEWVLYRLDGGIDHILVDEAQDTNEDQWAVIDTLVKPLLEGTGARDDVFRTLFVVGDDKQSIYGFQGAEPGIFDEKRRYYKTAFARVEHPFEDIPLNVSFRSQAPVLRFVDRLFEEDFLRKSLTDQDGEINHAASKMADSGTVTLWPLETGAPEKENAKWPLPSIEEKGEAAEKASAARLAEKIADEIAGWIARKRLLHTNKGARAVTADDILILLRRRSPFQKDLVRELKKRGVAVEGLDRMILTEHIAIQDILAAANVALLPEDDYALACLLKSPLIGWDDEKLMALCLPRQDGQHLIETLKDEAILSWLQDLQELARTQTPYGFFASLLASPCPADPKGSGWRAIYRRLSEEAFDPLETFLGQAASWVSARQYQGLQAFVAEAATAQTEIKREMEKANGRVRIMTAHGAKGLQAPIVILADAARSKQSLNQMSAIESRLYTDREDMTILATTEARKNVAVLTNAQNRKQNEEIDEYRRLLYVALTRAEDELYICGSINKESDLSEESWYSLAHKLFREMETTPPTGYTIEHNARGHQIFRREAPLPQAELREADEVKPEKERLLLPEWVFTPVPHHEEKTRILQPSKAALPDERLISPLDPHIRTEGERRFKRGLIIHAALQFVPDLPEARRDQALKVFLAQKAHRLSDTQQQEIAAEILTILQDPVFAPVFGEGSKAEVPILGEAGNEKERVSGQVDRLVILPDKVLIIDYKTNRPAPENPEDIPQAYRVQLRAYKDILSRIYKDREISCGLLWTHIPRLVNVDV
ncbi:MAG: double-strand break repair helicase AddA [Pseudobdellovibrionaceae bacterium]